MSGKHNPYEECQPGCDNCKFARMTIQFIKDGGMQVLQHFDAESGTLRLPPNFAIQLESSPNNVSSLSQGSSSSSEGWFSAESHIETTTDEFCSLLSIKDSQNRTPSPVSKTSMNRRSSINRRRSSRRSSFRVSAILNYDNKTTLIEQTDESEIVTPKLCVPPRKKTTKSKIPVPHKAVGNAKDDPEATYRSDKSSNSSNTLTESLSENAGIGENEACSTKGCGQGNQGNWCMVSAIVAPKKRRPSFATHPKQRLSFTNPARKQPNSGNPLKAVTNKSKKVHNHANCFKHSTPINPFIRKF